MSVGSELEVAATPEAVENRLSELAADWAGTWTPAEGGGRLEIPSLAGLRVGWLKLQVGIEAKDEGARVQWSIDEERWRIQGTVVVILLLAAVGGLTVVVAPFFPKLLPLVPLGIMLGVGAWLFVVARLRNAGPEELFDQLREVADD